MKQIILAVLTTMSAAVALRAGETRIIVSNMEAAGLNRLLPTVREGRFILRVHRQDESEMMEVLGHVRTTAASQ